MASPPETAQTLDPYKDEDDFSEDENDVTFKRFSSKYKLGRTLGTGGFSVVKKAENRKTHDQVAVKIVKQQHGQQIMDREIEIMKRVANHPNILHLYDVFQTRKNIYMVMELAEGGEVFDHIVKHGEYSERDASIVARKIVEAVRYLHEHGIAHRDLKPQNLLCAGGDATDIRIADFGLSKVFDEQTMMKTCFTLDHQVLTNKGFLSLSQFETRQADDGLLVAAYDPKTQQIVYEPMDQLIINSDPGHVQDMVMLDDGKSVKMVVTPGHDMFVKHGQQCASSGAVVWYTSSFSKIKARDLRTGPTDVYQFCSLAANGVQQSDEEDSSIPLWIRNSNEPKAALETYGSQLLHSSSVESWVYSLGKDQLRCILRGLDPQLRCISGISTATLRDDLIRLALHAGLGAASSLSDHSWSVSLVDSSVCDDVDAFPVLSGSKHISKVEYSGRTWCVKVPHGHIITRHLDTTRPVIIGNCCGSPEYVAPEILMCMSYDEAVDMWSIGIIIYILLTGCFPFWSENVQTLYQKIMNGAYRWPAKPEVSDSAKDLVRRLLEKNPKKRITATDCLRHPWITGQGCPIQCSPRDWKDVQDSRRKVVVPPSQTTSTTTTTSPPPPPPPPTNGAPRLPPLV